MSCAGRRNSIGHSYLRPTFSLPANAPASSNSVKTNFWLLLTVKATYPPKTLRSHSWTSWNSRSTLANDSRSGTDDKSMHELSGGAKSQSSTTNDMTTKELGNVFSRNQLTRHRSGPMRLICHGARHSH